MCGSITYYLLVVNSKNLQGKGIISSSFIISAKKEENNANKYKYPNYDRYLPLSRFSDQGDSESNLNIFHQFAINVDRSVYLTIRLYNT